jgi:hypothetical protein
MCTKHMGVQLIGVANKTLYLGRSWALPNNSKHNEADFLMISIDLLCLRIAHMPRSPDLAIFLLTTDNSRQTHKPTALPLLCMCACGVIISLVSEHACIAVGIARWLPILSDPRWTIWRSMDKSMHWQCFPSFSTYHNKSLVMHPVVQP